MNTPPLILRVPGEFHRTVATHFLLRDLSGNVDADPDRLRRLADDDQLTVMLRASQRLSALDRGHAPDSLDRPNGMRLPIIFKPDEFPADDNFTFDEDDLRAIRDELTNISWGRIFSEFEANVLTIQEMADRIVRSPLSFDAAIKNEGLALRFVSYLLKARDCYRELGAKVEAGKRLSATDQSVFDTLSSLRTDHDSPETCASLRLHLLFKLDIETYVQLLRPRQLKSMGVFTAFLKGKFGDRIHLGIFASEESRTPFWAELRKLQYTPHLKAPERAAVAEYVALFAGDLEEWMSAQR